jgi:uncharacterized protein YpmS
MSPKFVKIILFGLAAVVFLLVSVLYGLKYLAQKPPEFYAVIIENESVTSSAQVHEKAESLVQDFMQLRNDLANDPEWAFRLTEETVNAWLAENPLQSRFPEVPPELSDLRLKFEMERIRIAFRWRGKPLESVVSIAIKPEVLASNEIQIGFEQIQAGALPVGISRFQQIIEDAINQNGKVAEWVDSKEIPTLKLKISPRLEKRLIVIEKTTVIDKEIRLSGKSKKIPKS